MNAPYSPTSDTCEHGLSAWLCAGPGHYPADDHGDDLGPRLWDATPGVCCAAFQLGACEHSEAGMDDYWDDDLLDCGEPGTPDQFQAREPIVEFEPF
jgi:hypothetical protein